MKKTVVAALLLAGLPAWSSAQERPGRARPPEAVTCPRDNLTVYTGRVTALDRGADSTHLTIATDWKTTEKVLIQHADKPTPDAYFLMAGKPFVKADWDTIAPKGKLREGVRANAWVCTDKRNAVVDWLVGS